MDTMLHKVANLVLGENHGKNKTKVNGKVVLMKKNVLDFNDLGASILDRAHELFGKHISIQFISATHADSGSSGLFYFLVILRFHLCIEPCISTNI
ncbi:putative linoleate 9S-lipoxygenase [Helianthus anomalus]